MQPQNNTCGVATQHLFANPLPHKRLRLVRFDNEAAKKSLLRENTQSFPQTDFLDVVRKLHIFRSALSERNRTSNPRLQSDLDRFLSSVKDDIQDMITDLPGTFPVSLYTLPRNTPKNRLTMTVRFGVYGAAALLVERTQNTMHVDYDLTGINLEFCAIPGTRQAIESIVLELLEAVQTGRFSVKSNRVFNGFPELQKRQLALLNDGGVA